MKIVMLTNVVAPDKLGGLERYVRELSAGLVRDGVSVSVVSKRTGASQPDTEIGEDGVEILRYDPPRKSDPMFALKYPRAIAAGVREALKGTSNDGRIVLHGHFPIPVLPLLQSKRRFMYTCHAPVYKEIKSERQGSYLLPGPVEAIAVAGVKGLERQVVRRASTIITLSEFVRSEVMTLDADAGAGVRLVPGGIDLGRFTAAAHAVYPRVLGGTGPVLFAARRMVLRTGVEQLVQAVKILRDRGVATRLVLGGDGPRREAIESYISEHELGETVHLLGRISEEELVAWYQSADLAVTPTQELEGFGLSTAEAMACGAPPLVTPIGANAEVVRQLPPETISTDATPAGMADAIAILLSNPTLLDDIRSKVVAAAQPFGWAAVCARHIELYEQHLRGA